jgi:hypothetical protein
MILILYNLIFDNRVWFNFKTCWALHKNKKKGNDASVDGRYNLFYLKDKKNRKILLSHKNSNIVHIYMSLN